MPWKGGWWQYKMVLTVSELWIIRTLLFKRITPSLCTDFTIIHALPKTLRIHNIHYTLSLKILSPFHVRMLIIVHYNISVKIPLSCLTYRHNPDTRTNDIRLFLFFSFFFHPSFFFFYYSFSSRKALAHWL